MAWQYLSHPVMMTEYCMADKAAISIPTELFDSLRDWIQTVMSISISRCPLAGFPHLFNRAFAA